MLVGFHPQFRFADEEPDDPSNGVNRSPYPAVHLLRQESVTDAIDAQPDLAGAVPHTNKRLLRSMGAQRMAQLVGGCLDADGGEEGAPASRVDSSDAPGCPHANG